MAHRTWACPRRSRPPLLRPGLGRASALAPTAPTGLGRASALAPTGTHWTWAGLASRVWPGISGMRTFVSRVFVPQGSWQGACAALLLLGFARSGGELNYMVGQQ